MIDINGDIEFHNINFVYGTRQDQLILNNLNLVARAGETTALVGHSGCGELRIKYLFFIKVEIFYKLIVIIPRKKYMSITSTSLLFSFIG